MNSNATLTQTIGFYIAGFQYMQYTEYYYIFLAFVYIGTVLGNFLLMFIIWHAEVLHTPKYMVVFSLAVIDVTQSTTLIPKCIQQFLFDMRFVKYELCLTQMFFVHFFYSIESFSLMIMAYERLVSICFPLRSSSIITNARMFAIIAFFWFLGLIMLLSGVVFMSRLSFCKPVPVVLSYFCDHGPVFKLACSDNSPSWRISYAFIIITIYVPLAFIIVSYVCIGVAVSRIKSVGGRWKALKTCVAHLILVAIFFVPILVVYMISWISITIDTNTRILNSSLSSALPPLVNPIIYTLKTEEVVQQIKNVLHKNRVQNLM